MDLDSILTGSGSILKNKQKFKKIQARRVTSIKFGEIIQKFRQNAKIANIDKFEVLKTVTDAKVSQANKRNPDDSLSTWLKLTKILQIWPRPFETT